MKSEITPRTRVRILPRTEDVEVAQADGLEAVEPGETGMYASPATLERVRRQRLGGISSCLGRVGVSP